MREALRVFSVDRIASPRRLSEAVYEPPAEHVAAELDSSYGIFTGKAENVAVLQFNDVAARWVAEEEWHPGVKSKHQVGGGGDSPAPYKPEAELVMDVLRRGANVDVLGPEGLRRAVAQALTGAAQQCRGYKSGSGGSSDLCT